VVKVFVLVGQFIVLPPCVSEDAHNCYWDAQSMRNHVGKSFIDIDGEVLYDIPSFNMPIEEK